METKTRAMWLGVAIGVAAVLLSDVPMADWTNPEGAAYNVVRLGGAALVGGIVFRAIGGWLESRRK